MLPALALATTAERAMAQTNDTSYPKCPELATYPVNAAKQASAVRPNILYIMCDDHSMQTISAYGSALSKLAPTPNIDRLARGHEGRQQGRRCGDGGDGDGKSPRKAVSL